MKHFFIIITSVVLFCSCGDGKIKKDIEGLVNSEIKDLTVKKVEIETEFYEYTEMTATTLEKHLNALRTVLPLQERFRELEAQYLYARDHHLAVQDEIYPEYYKVGTTINAMAEEAKKLNEEYDEFKATHEKGTLYVVKFYQKNEFGLFENEARYRVMTYSDEGKPYFYPGNSRIKIILSVYPEAKKDTEERISTNILLDLDKRL